MRKKDVNLLAVLALFVVGVAAVVYVSKGSGSQTGIGRYPAPSKHFFTGGPCG